MSYGPFPAIGDVYGRLTVIAKCPPEKDSRGWARQVFYCACSCGARKEIAAGSLQTGRSRSCGCLRGELVSARSTTHGMTSRPIYSVWNMMHQRCSLPGNKQYADYGGRGIKVCEEWKSFERFLEDMGEPPFKGASLERIDNSSGYYKGNCRWATRTEQARNKRNNVPFEYGGMSMLLVDWAKHLGIKKQTLASRLYLYGWSVEKAFTTPVCDATRRKEATA